MKKYRLRDRSYSIDVNLNGGKDNVSWEVVSRMAFTILAFKQGLPGSPSWDGGERRSDVIVLREDGVVTFTQMRFLREIPTCPHCGKEL